MEVKGTVIDILPVQTGEGRNGTWKKGGFVIETNGQYPKKVCIDVWGDKMDQWQIAQGQEVVASIEVESREYNGKWYTNVKAWKVESGGGIPASEAPQGSANPAPQSAPMPAASDLEADFDDDDLPF